MLFRSRLAMLLAVLERRAGVALAQHEVFASVAGGVRLGEPGADLGLCLALTSAATGVPVAGDVVAVGEVGLAGEVRQVGHLARRLGEAARLGFTRALVPHGAAASVSAPGLRVEPIASVADALRIAEVLGK